MCDCQHRESHAQPSACIDSAKRHAGGFKAELQYEQPGEEQEELAALCVRNLQEWICELLIRNQELRMSLLDLTTNRQSRETDQ
jgi:hypothetical protein